MDIDLMTDDLLTLAAVATKAHVHVGTVHRWIRVGVYNNRMDLVKLRTRKIAGRRYTSPEAYRKFVDQCSLEAEDEE